MLRFLIAMIIILLATTTMLFPGLEPPFNIPNPMAHFLVFFVLGYGLFTLEWLPRVLTLLLLGFLAVFLETGQFLVPSRTPEMLDIACNIVGATTAAFIPTGVNTKPV